MTYPEGTTCAIWARVSTGSGAQHNENQLHVLREWASRLGLDVVREFITEDSAWTKRAGKGDEFDRQREALATGAHRADYTVALIWALDRLSRRGYHDLDAVLRQLASSGCELKSYQEQWLTNLGPMGEVVVHMLALMSEQESARRSERIKAGIERRKREGKPVGGQTSKKGHGKGSKRPGITGEAKGWTPERRAAQSERNRQRWAARRAAQEAEGETG